MTAFSVGIRIGSIDISPSIRFPRYFFRESAELALHGSFGPVVRRFGL
jgi:hypothetical protein